MREVAARAGHAPDKLLVVGSFGSVPYLQSRIKRQFGSGLGGVLAPPFGYAVAVEGAVRVSAARLARGAGCASGLHPCRVGNKAADSVYTCVNATPNH